MVCKTVEDPYVIGTIRDGFDIGRFYHLVMMYVTGGGGGGGEGWYLEYIGGYSVYNHDIGPMY